MQLLRKTISIIDQKLLHDAAFMMVNIFDAQHLIAQTWRCVTHMTIVSCFQIRGFNLNQTSDGEDATELIAKDDWCQLKAGVFQCLHKFSFPRSC
jgi:hypothetical protein